MFVRLFSLGLLLEYKMKVHKRGWELINNSERRTISKINLNRPCTLSYVGRTCSFHCATATLFPRGGSRRRIATAKFHWLLIMVYEMNKSIEII